MKTIIPWISLGDKLPLIDKENNPDKHYGFNLSEFVIITNGYTIEYAQYVFEWESFSTKDYGKGIIGNPWYLYGLCGEGFAGDEFYYWCDQDSVILNLPKKPKIINSLINDNKKYTLKQLHQAWGAGFHEGKK